MVNPVGVVLALFGLAFATWPYKVARLTEQIDAIGSRRSSWAVEPAGWNVKLTRIVGVGMVLYGLLMAVYG